MKFYFLILLITGYSYSVAQVSINTTEFVYDQDFDSLASIESDYAWANNTTLNGWYAANQVDGDYISYRVKNGSSGGSYLYSFGTTEATDRSLGSINRNSISDDIAYGVLFHNSSGSTINSISISFTVEQWRRVQTLTKGYQRVKLSYLISNAFAYSASELLSNSGFVDLPEAYMLSIDTTSIAPHEALDGNAAQNRANVYIEVPIVLANNQDFFLRFYDENVDDIDAGLSVDDLHIEFSANVLQEIAAVSDYSVSAYLETGIVMDIPTENDGISYTQVDMTASNDFNDIFDNFYLGYYESARPIALNYGYYITSFSSGGVVNYTLRKNNQSTYYWGTFVSNTSPSKECVTIQAPHPIKDNYTGSQAVAVFDMMGAGNLMLAGISRCTSTEKIACDGQTSVCNAGNTDESYRISDVAHNPNTVFQIASVSLADIETNMTFVQLHGFYQQGGDPEFIFSNGTFKTPIVDNLASLKSAFQISFPTYKVNLVHIDGAPKLKALNNVFGRYLNIYQQDICTSSTDPTIVSGRFMHLEQFIDFRKDVTLYDDLANMLNTSIDCAVILPVELVSFLIQENTSGGVLLEWEVAWEQNVNYYAIERSIDGILFDEIGWKTSINSGDRTTYSFTDFQCPAGPIYYRLKVVDFDGTYTYSTTSFLDTHSTQSIFPNPVKSELYILDNEPGKEVKIRTSNGKEVIRKIKRIGNKYGIDLSGLTSGVLLIEINAKRYRVVKLPD